MKRIAIALLAVFCFGCTDAGCRRAVGTYGVSHKIVLYSGGQRVAEWESTGRPQSLEAEDGWQFVDRATGKLTIVTGDLVITD